MGGLLLLASLRTFFQPTEVLVAWGADGALPAVCYSSCSSAGMRQYTVLCPGGSNAASQLLFALEKRGCSRLESIFASVVAPSPRGTRVLLKKKPAAALILFADAGRRASALDLSAEARRAGIGVRELHLAPGRESSRHQHWEFRSWKGKNGDMHWSFYHLREQVQINLSWQKNGILELQYLDRFSSKTTKQFPRSNRCGTWQACLSSR